MRRSASLRPLTFIALSALALPIFAVQGQEATSRASIQAIPKAERPMLAVRDIEFQAQLSSDERRELNQWTALATIFGGRRDATMDARPPSICWRSRRPRCSRRLCRPPETSVCSSAIRWMPR